MTAKTVLFVCTSCGAKDGRDSAGRGAILLPMLQNALANDTGIDVRPVGCLSNCDHGISVALTGAGKFGWLFGQRGESAEDVEKLAHAARVYTTLSDGFLAKADRAKPVMARIPPMDFTVE